VISALVFFMTRMNLALRKAVNERTAEVASASARLESANDDLKTSNELLLKSNSELAEKESELRKVITKALEVERSKQEFSSMITHELKTPLVPIIGYGSLFLNDRLGELTPRQKEKLQIIFNSAKKLAALSQDLLDVQKLELGELHLGMADASASQIIESSINSLATEAEARNIILVNNSNGGVVLKCDPDRIAQVLNNLVNNAIKFSHDRGTIELDAKMQDDSVVFSVKDSGIGIPKAKQDKIFTKFYQVDTSLTRKAGGTGLGLAVCKGIVEAHGGRIWLESEEGKGSIFSFSIPVCGANGKENTGR
jgi:signal transduction histidine kinase